MSALADALKGGGKFIAWDDLGQGTVISGTITDVAMRQSRKFESTDLDFWDDGAPKMQAIIELQTTLRDPANPDDEGRRSISVNLWSGQKKALADACRAAGVPEPTVGDTFAAVWTSGVGKAKDPRQFAYKITPGTGLGDALSTLSAGLGAKPVDPFTAAATASATAAAPVQQQMPADHLMAPQAAPAAPAPAPAANPVENAKALLRAGMSQAEVAVATGYSPEVIAALANQL